MEKKRLALAGCGYLGTIIAQAWKDGFLEDYHFIGAVSRTMESAERIASLTGCKACRDIDEMMALKPDFVVEAANPQTVMEIGKKILSQGASLVVLSMGAFADRGLFEELKETAARKGTKLYLSSGVIGGFDALRSISLMSMAKNQPVVSGISTHKGPDSLKGTPVFTESLMTETEEREVFSGNASQAISLFPTKVNVAVATALASAGADATGVKITSVPGFVGDDHKITIETEGVKAVIDIYSSTCDMAAWSVVSLLRNLSSPVVFQ